MSKLNKYKLDTLYEISSGISTKPEQYGNGTPFLSFSTIFNNYFIPDELKELMNTTEKEQEVYSIKKGDIFLTRTSETLNELAMSCVALKDYPQATFSGFAKRLRPIQKNITYDKFMGFFLRSKYFRKIIDNNAIMTLRASFNEKIFSYLNVELPEYEEQVKIGNLLHFIEEKIKTNNKINIELEKLAKTLYDYWFVQFDFPDENERPYKSSGGAMVYNEILKRDIPVGWEVENISKYCNIIDCLHSKKPDFCYEANNLYLLQLENLTNDGYIDITNKYYISKDDYKSWTQKIEIQENDFVFTNAGRTGAFGKIPKYIKCALGRNLTAIRPISISPYYLRMYFGSNDMRQQVLSNLDCGAFFKSFNVKSIKLIALLIPQENILNNFILKISPIIKQIETNNIETQFLTEVRDFLLPMLMNGQVTIRQ